MTNRHQILIVDDEADIRDLLSDILKSSGYMISTAANLTDALNLISRRTFSLIIADIFLGTRNGLELLNHVHSHSLDTPLIMISGDGDWDLVNQVMDNGAFDFLQKPVHARQLLSLTNRAIRYSDLMQGNRLLNEELDTYREKFDRYRSHTLDEVQLERSHFESFADHSTDIIFRVNPAGELIYCNRTVSEILGYDRDVFLSQPRSLLNSFLPADVAAFKTAVDQLSQTKEAVSALNLGLRTRQDETVYMSISLSPVLDLAGNLTSIQGIARNITNQIVAERSLQRMNHELITLNYVARAVNSSKDTQEVIYDVLGVLHEQFRFSFTALVELRSAKVQYRRERGRSENFQNFLDHHLVNDSKLAERAHGFSLKELGEPFEYAYLFPIGRRSEALSLFYMERLEDLPIDDQRILNAVANFLGTFLENRQLMNAVMTAKREWQTVFDSIDDLLIVINDDFEVVRVNRAVQTRISKDYNQLLGLRISRRLQKIVEQAEQQSEVFSIDNFKLFPSVGVVLEADYEFSIVELDDIPELTGNRLLVGRDVTERNKYKQAQQELEVQLMQEAKLSSVGLLVSGLAHNMSSPLQSIIGYSQMMQIQEPDNQNLQMVVAMAGQLKEIINNLMYKLRQEQSLEEQDININQLLEQELEFLKANLRFKHDIEKNYEFDPDIPLLKGVYGDFSQGIMNIVNNAVDAMYETDKKQLTIRTFTDPEHLIISIADTGVGISKYEMKKIFDPFFSTKPHLKERVGEEPVGTGLGLSSSYFLLARYGVRFDVRSQPGEGTEFTLYFPLHHNMPDEQPS